MAEYIDRDIAIRTAIEMCVKVVGHGITQMDAAEIAIAFEDIPTADVVPKSEEGAECPTCHGTGRIGTTDWLTKGLSKKQLAEEKAKAIAEHEQHIKTEVAREIFEEIESISSDFPIYGNVNTVILSERDLAFIKKKYTEDINNG